MTGCLVVRPAAAAAEAGTAAPAPAAAASEVVLDSGLLVPSSSVGWSWSRARGCLGAVSSRLLSPHSAASLRSRVRRACESDTTARACRWASRCAHTLAPTTSFLLARAHQRWHTRSSRPHCALHEEQQGLQTKQRSHAASDGATSDLQLRRLLCSLDDDGAVSAAPRFSLRRSVRHSVRALGLAPVRHSVWGARTPSAAAESASRLAIALIGSSTSLALLGLLGSGITLGSLGALSAVSHAIRSRLPHFQLLDVLFGPLWRLVPGVRMKKIAGRAVGDQTSAGGLRLLAAVRWLSARLEEEIEQVREMEGLARFGALSFLLAGSVAILSVSTALATTLGWIEPQREGFDHISSSMQQAGVALTAKQEASLSLGKPHSDSAGRVLGALLDAAHFYSGPLVEEMAVVSALFLCGPSLLTRTVVAGALVGGAHWTVSGKKVASTVIRAALTEAMRGASPLLPVLFHAVVNYLSLDAFVAISPLRGLKLREGVLVADESTRDLFLELQHFFDPRHAQPFLATATLLRSTPLRLLMPQTRHAIFAQPPSKDGWVWGSPRPPPNQLSAHYSRVACEVFSLLDSTSCGYLDVRQFAFIYLLRHEPLEVLRGAFDALDSQLAHDECSAALRDIEARRFAAWTQARAQGAAHQAEWSGAKHFDDLARAARLNSQPLQPFVIHPTRSMPADEDHLHPHELPFVCAEWIGAPRAPRAAAAHAWLLSSLREAGGTRIHDPRRHYAANNEPMSSGWSRGALAAVLADDDAPVPPLPVEVVPRFRKLMALFRTYTELLMAAAFQTHLAHYGEVVPTDEQEGSPEAAPSSRRFTPASFHAFIRDLALVDAPSTDALLTQCVLVLNGSMPHPMHTFNVTCAEFGREQP